MRAVVATTTLTIALCASSCGRERTVAEICQESSDIYEEATGSGLTAGGMQGCLRLSAEEAARQQEALKEMAAEMKKR